MLILGPLVLIGTWPWLWHDTGRRLLAYARFHLGHVHYTYEYLGVSYFEPPLPVSVPFVMTLFTVSLTVLVLCLLGLYDRRAALRLPWLTEPRASGGRRTEVLWFGCLLAPLFVIALPSSPIFGGTKHWITAYPFLALFAGLGFVALRRASRDFRLDGPALADLGVRDVSAFCLGRSKLRTAIRLACRTTRRSPAACRAPPTSA